MNICCAGEVMVELAGTGAPGQYQRAIAGDTYNTAVYLARAGFDVSYLTRLGDDVLSRDILAQLDHEGIDTSAIRLCPNRQPGLYMIDNDASGERSFHYWRAESPARELFAQPVEPPDADVFYFSGITLAITRQGQAHLLALMATLRQRGTRIVFDPNYRPALWSNLREARDHCEAVLSLCDMVLPTLEDDNLLWGIQNQRESQAFYAAKGVAEIVIKCPDLSCHAYADSEQASTTVEPVQAVDTTGAGDSFNAAYLAARLQGATLSTALNDAQALAREVVQHRGAILPGTT